MGGPEWEKDAADKAGDFMRDAKDKAGDALGDAKDKAGDMLGGAKDKDAVGKTGEKVENLVGKAGDKTGDMFGGAKNRADRALNDVKGGRGKWWWLVLAAAVVIALLWWGASCNSNKNSSTKPSGSTGQTGSASAGQGSTATVTENPLRFTVGKPELVKSVGSGSTTKQAQGHFAVIPMTVENVSDQDAIFSGAIQRLTGSDGRVYLPDVSILRYMPESSSLYKTLAPGASASGHQMYDLPEDVTPASMTLHSVSGSKGVSVDLP